MSSLPTTEDEVRSRAGQLLGIEDVDPKSAQAGVGQVTTFNQLGFKGEGSSLKPDGWYLPVDRSSVAILLETKARDSVPIESPKLKRASTEVLRCCALPL